jgi:hypothetical protein
MCYCEVKEVGHEVSMGETRRKFRILEGKPLEKGSLV